MNLNAGLRYHGGSWPLVMHHQTTGQPRFFNLWKTEVPKACSSTDFLLNRPRIIMIFKKNHDFPPRNHGFRGFPPPERGFSPPRSGGVPEGGETPPGRGSGGGKSQLLPPLEQFPIKTRLKNRCRGKNPVISILARKFGIFWPPPGKGGFTPPFGGGKRVSPPFGGFPARNGGFGGVSG